MLRKFTTDTPFRALQTDMFTASDDECLLGSKTVVYGRNGSGKTSFSELLRLAAQAATADDVVIELNLRMDGQNRKCKSASFPEDLRFAVYNRFYVEESLGEFLEGTGTSAPIIQLGKVNVDAQRRLEQLDRDVTKLESWEDGVQGLLSRLAEREESAEKYLKSQIIGALAIGNAAAYNPTRFTVAAARKLLTQKHLVKIPAGDFEVRLQVANSASLNPVPRPAVPVNSGPLVEEIAEVLATEIASTPIPALAIDRKLAAWVEDGLELHSEGDSCAFCMDGVVTSRRMDELRLHFSRQLRSLREEIQKLDVRLTAQVDEYKEFLASLPGGDRVLADHRSNFLEELRVVESGVAVYSRGAASAQAFLSDRLGDPLAPMTLGEADLSILTLEAPSFDKIINILQLNNNACASQAKTKAAAQKAVEEHLAEPLCANYQETVARQVLGRRTLLVLSARKRLLQTTAGRLHQDQRDTGIMANKIDADLKQQFNHNHLSVDVTPDGKAYQVTRSGLPAHRLSEGERNAIAFCYFLATLEAREVKKESTVVVIDDPVTSLDKEALFAAFAMAEERTRQFCQSIFLTHNFELFRLLLNQRQNALKKSRKRILEGHASETAYPAVAILELYSSVDEGTGVKSSKFRKMPQVVTDHATEYHYLFWKVASAAAGGAGDELPLLGNGARRLVEGFISFRAPHGNNFQEKVTNIATERGISGELSARVVKFLHGHSHREEPNPSVALDFPALEEELRQVLLFIEAADPAHFRNMCTAVAVALPAFR